MTTPSTHIKTIAKTLNLPSSSLSSLEQLPPAKLALLHEYLLQGLQYQEQAHRQAIPKWLTYLTK